MKKVVTIFLLLAYGFITAQENYEQLYNALNLELGLRNLAENTLQHMQGYNATLTDAKVSEVLATLNFGKFKEDIIEELKENIPSDQVDNYLATGTVSEIVTGEDLLLYDIGKTAGRDLMFQIINLLKVDKELDTTPEEEQAVTDSEFSIPTGTTQAFCRSVEDPNVLESGTNVWNSQNSNRPYYRLCSDVGSSNKRKNGYIFHESLGLIGKYVLHYQDLGKINTYHTRLYLDYNSTYYPQGHSKYDENPYKTIEIIALDKKIILIKNLKINVSEEYQSYLERERLPPQETYSLRDLPISVCERISAGFTHDVEDIQVTLPYYDPPKVNDEGTRGYLYNEEGVILATYAFDDDTCTMNGDGTRTYNTLRIKAIRDLNVKEGECLDFHVDELFKMGSKTFVSEVPQRMGIFYYDGDGDGYHRAEWTEEKLAGSSTITTWRWSENTLGIDCNDLDASITTECHNCNNSTDPNCGQQQLIWYYDGDQDSSYGQMLEQDEYPGENWTLHVLPKDLDDTNPNIK